MQCSARTRCRGPVKKQSLAVARLLFSFSRAEKKKGRHEREDAVVRRLGSWPHRLVARFPRLMTWILKIGAKDLNSRENWRGLCLLSRRHLAWCVKILDLEPALRQAPHPAPRRADDCAWRHERARNTHIRPSVGREARSTGATLEHRLRAVDTSGGRGTSPWCPS